jgi:predicted transcriptional regulator
LRAILLGILVSEAKALTVREVTSRLSSLVGRDVSNTLDEAVQTALAGLSAEGLISTPQRGEFIAAKKGIELENRYSNQFKNIQRLFQEQVVIDLTLRLPGVKPSAIASLSDIVHRCLMRIFEQRGAELVESAFSDSFEAGTSLSLTKIINEYIGGVTDSERHVLFP